MKLQHATYAQDSSGSTTETWTDIASIWAKIQPLSGRLLDVAKQAQSEVTHEITIRYRENVTPDKRIKYGSRIFVIESVINIDERNYWLVLRCKETVAGK
ncbi:MAG: phage head closure protein [Candidatus Omnitrophica bacterium]|nr:phage head closure protein [Candidatus Omnitrophota bacterium]